MEQSKNTNRRQFIGNAAALGALGIAGFSQILHSCKPGGKPVELGLTPFLDRAPDGEPLRAGVIGCGGRGTGAAINFLNAGNDLSIVAVADVFQDRIDSCREKIKDEKGVEIDDANCFMGFDAYKRLLETDVNYIIIATPPYFRPEQFQAAVEARMHVFMEKPVAVDPVGARMIIAASREAEAAGLSVATGTQRRHARDYTEVFKQVRYGAIGDIVAANVYWNSGKLWHRDPQPKRTEMENMLRDWVNWTWLSGDHIVEQHLHNIDVINWFTGMHPVKALGFGGRHRRQTGDQFDFFSIDFVYENGIHIHSMCRQISGCSDNVSEHVRGTKGYSNCVNTLFEPDGEMIWEYPYELDEEGNPKRLGSQAYFQEHIDLVTAIRTNKPINEAENTAISTMTAIMGRISCYTGKEVTWEEMMNSDLKIGPDKIEVGPSDYRAVVPVPGTP
ncbi:MAG: Gfo/Idh/MocA family oxidoreductase [Candidatus Latescibacteria bacterium]|nr:Gfo/Idh/MocA family oxidoreductase [Candidatus Latescibacterota bacterium]